MDTSWVPGLPGFFGWKNSELWSHRVGSIIKSPMKVCESLSTRFFRVTFWGVLFVTFSGAKTWPPTRESKGHMEEAGSWWFQPTHLEKCSSNWIMKPQIGMNIEKCLKPPALGLRAQIAKKQRSKWLHWAKTQLRQPFQVIRGKLPKKWTKKMTSYMSIAKRHIVSIPIFRISNTFISIPSHQDGMCFKDST